MADRAQQPAYWAEESDVRKVCKGAYDNSWGTQGYGGGERMQQREIQIRGAIGSAGWQKAHRASSAGCHTRPGKRPLQDCAIGKSGVLYLLAHLIGKARDKV